MFLDYLINICNCRWSLPRNHNNKITLLFVMLHRQVEFTCLWLQFLILHYHHWGWAREGLSHISKKTPSFLLLKSSVSGFLIDSPQSCAARWHDIKDDEAGRATIFFSGSLNNKHLLVSTERQQKGNHGQKDSFLSAHCSSYLHDSSKAIPITGF